MSLTYIKKLDLIDTPKNETIGNFSENTKKAIKMKLKEFIIHGIEAFNFK